MMQRHLKPDLENHGSHLPRQQQQQQSQAHQQQQQQQQGQQQPQQQQPRSNPLVETIPTHQPRTPSPPPPPNTSWTKDKKVLYSNHDTLTQSSRRTMGQKLTSPMDKPEHNRFQHEDLTTSQAPLMDDQNVKDNTINDITNTHNNNPPLGNTNASASNSTVIGHYELKRTLGKGNFSTVKLAQHKITQHLVAIKVVKTSVLSDDNLMKINREIDVLKKIGKHDHIVRLYQVIKTKRYFMLVTEYCANGELYDYLVDKGKLSEPQSCNYFLQILSAVEYLHDHNVVHRDLKAENLLLSDNFKTVKIADFGFANYYKNDKLLSTWCGSPPYAAPELFKGLQYVGPPVDIWSMGVILYVLVCGSLPFDGHNLVYLKSRVLSGKFRIPFFMSTECEGLIRGMLRLDPDRRFSIRQIRAHCWTVKHSSSLPKDGAIDSNAHMMLMYTGGGSTSGTKIGSQTNSEDQKNSDKSCCQNLGQSLDLDDDKKKTSNEDLSMVYLDEAAADPRLTSSRCSQKDAIVKPSKIQNLVDIDMANAVSNMSLDSNNSAMSVSQGVETSANLSNPSSGASTVGGSRGNGTRTDTCKSASRNLTKEASIDDQIIDFMIENLKVAENQNQIRQSIAADKYDDLHAIYRLLKDEPKIIFQMLSSARFKIPSLPLISLNKQQSIKKPSITTGFFDANKTDPVNDETTSGRISNKSENKTAESGAINLTTRRESCTTRPLERQRKSEDSSWTVPPQLFLTPPCEGNNQASNQVAISCPKQTDNGGENSLVNEGTSATAFRHFTNEAKQVLARHSFDSTMQQLNKQTDVAGLSDNRLALGNCAKQCLWDSSVLDTLGVSTPPPNSNQAVEMKLDCIPNCTNLPGNVAGVFQAANFTGMATDLQHMGAMTNFQNPINQNLLLAQLNSLALSAAVTQSSMLTQCNSMDQKYQIAVQPIKFTNNLVNQTYNAKNNLAIQNPLESYAPVAPDVSLLDPNGSISAFERRASDGQASYNSLTTNTTSDQVNVPLEQNQSKDPVKCSGSTANTTVPFLSSSSNQLNSPLNRFSTQGQTTQSGNSPQRNNEYQPQNVSNNPMMIASVDPQIADCRSKHEDKTILCGATQTNPLDLTKCHQDSCWQREIGLNLSADTNLQSFDNQQPAKTPNQRSQSTTSASTVFPNLPASAATSPRISLFRSGATNNNTQNPFSQISPSSISLTAGGPGHLLNRRKRHSLENESRNPHYKQQHSHHQPPTNHQYATNSNSTSTYNESSRSLRQTNQQYLHFPASSHIGQLRSFAQTFSYKSMKKPTNSSHGWDSSKAPSVMINNTNVSIANKNPINYDTVKSDPDKDLIG